MGYYYNCIIIIIIVKQHLNLIYYGIIFKLFIFFIYFVDIYLYI